MRKNNTVVRCTAMGIAFVCMAGIATPADEQSKFRRVVKHAFSPIAIVRAGAGAGLTQATNTPAEWGQGAAGFGNRLSSAFGKHLVKTAIQYPIASFRHEEIEYHPSGKHGFGPRVEYALLSTVITHKTTTGNRTVATGEITGAFGSGLISRLWQPASVRGLSYGFMSGGITLGVDAGGRVLREFWPEIRHPRRSHNPDPADQ